MSDVAIRAQERDKSTDTISAVLAQVLENQLLLLALSPGSESCKEVQLAISKTEGLLRAEGQNSPIRTRTNGVTRAETQYLAEGGAECGALRA